MKYFANFKDGLLVEIDTGLISGENCENTEVPYELYTDYKLTPNKYIAGEKEIEIDVPDYDKDGNPIMIEYEDTETVIDYDDEGNPIGSHEITVIKHKQQTHKETVLVSPYPVLNPNFDSEELEKAKNAKNAENTEKAKLAVENGFVTFKNAEFETNAQTVGDLTATMLLMQSSGLETYTWLSKDDKAVELTVEDFGTLGGLIAQFKNTVWNDKYLTFKAAIKKAKTVAAVEKVVIDYDITDTAE